MIRFQRRIPYAALLAIAFGAVACGVPETGTPPPRDELYYPVGLAAHPDGRYLYVLNGVFDRKYNAGTITVYDTFARRILPRATHEVGLFGGEIVMGRFPGAAGDSQVMAFFTTREQNRLSALRIQAGEGDGPEHLHCDNDENGRCLETWAQTHFETKSGEIAGMPGDPYSLALGADTLMVSHVDRGEVSHWRVEFDADLDASLPVFECRINLPEGATSIARHPVLDWAYVSDRFGEVIQTVERLDPLDRGERGFVSDDACRLETRAELVIASSNLSGRTRGLAFSADSTLLYVASNSDDSLRIFDTSVRSEGRPRNRLIAAVPLGDGPNLVRVAGLRAGEQYAAALADRGEVGRIIDEKGGGLVYVTAFNDDRLIVVDPAILSVIARIDVGAGPHDIALMPDGEGRLLAYVSNFRDHTLSVVDLEPGSPTRFQRVAVIP